LLPGCRTVLGSTVSLMSSKNNPGSSDDDDNKNNIGWDHPLEAEGPPPKYIGDLIYKLPAHVEFLFQPIPNAQEYNGFDREFNVSVWALFVLVFLYLNLFNRFFFALFFFFSFSFSFSCLFL